MRVVDPTEQDLPLFFVCLEEWSEEMKGAGDHKARWYARMKDRGLGVKLALDDDGTVAGMIQYVPIEHSAALGRDLYFITCTWVHGYEKEGRGNLQQRGFGKAMLAAAEEDAESRGARGIAAWGLSQPYWMPAAWYVKRGYEEADEMEGCVLVWKRFVENAAPPRWLRRRRTPEATPGVVTVSAFINGWCPSANIGHERARRAAASFGPEVRFRSIETDDQQVRREWGISDAIFVDEVEIPNGPPPSYESIRSAIEERVKSLGT